MHDTEHAGATKYHKRCRAAHDLHQDDEDKKVVIQEFNMVRSKVFNFYGIRPVISVN